MNIYLSDFGSYQEFFKLIPKDHISFLFSLKLMNKNNFTKTSGDSETYVKIKVYDL